VCDDDGCAPELFEEAKFKSENDCDEDGCVPKFDEPVSAVTGEAKKEQ
jgi:NhaA family Na+:H+ antiporter